MAKKVKEEIVVTGIKSDPTINVFTREEFGKPRPERMRVREEIVVREKRPPKVKLDKQQSFPPGSRRARQLEDLIRDARVRIAQDETRDLFLKRGQKPPAAKPALKPVVDEIVVTAKKIPKKALTIFSRVFGAPVGIAEAAALIADKVSQRRLDETAAFVLAPDRTPPDTPLETIGAQAAIPEIVVTAKRPDPVVPDFQRQDFIDALTTPVIGFPSQRVQFGAGQKIAAPKLPGKRRAAVIDPLTIGSRLESTSIAELAGLRAFARAGAGQGTSSSTTSLIRAAALPRTQTSAPRLTAAGICPPCKKKKPKKRNKCYKKLVKERRDPSNDKSFRFVQIDCDTGKELPKQRK